MEFTRHAQIRKQQRGFSGQSLEIINEYGRRERLPGGAMRLFFGRREYQRAVAELKKSNNKDCHEMKETIRIMDRAKNGSIVIKEGRILTVYK